MAGAAGIGGVGSSLSFVRWAGGKGKQLSTLLPFIPPGDRYVEPFGGGASVLLNKPPSNVDVYNDLDHGLINLYQVVREEATFTEFYRRVMLTPYSREMFEEALTWEEQDDPVRRAVFFYVMLNQSISGKRLARKGDWSRGMKDNVAERWFKRLETLPGIFRRLQSVQIECRDALDILEEWDNVRTVFYCDPPYVMETRNKKKYYAVEQDNDFHERMVEVLLNVKGAVTLSGYDHPVYDPLMEAGWIADGYSTAALMAVTDGQKADRREVVWRNRRAAEASIMNPIAGMDEAIAGALAFDLGAETEEADNE